MLSLTAVNQYYGQNHILWDINLEIPRGQCTCLIGRNGVGKTTLINCIMGHLPVMSGTMTWQPNHEPPQNLLQQPVEGRTALGIGYVPQGQQIFSQMSVEENMLIAVLAGHKSRHIPGWVLSCSPCYTTSVINGVENLPATSNNSWRLPARWSPNLNC